MITVPVKAWQLYRPGGMVQKLYRRLARSRLTPSYFPYNITLSERQKFIWFRVAKVGTRTIYRHLREHADLDVEHAHDLRYPAGVYEDYFKFAFVRNPWDRLVSAWKNKVLKTNYFQFDDETWAAMHSFDNFVEFVAAQKIDRCDVHLRAQTALVDLNHLDYLGRFETMDEDLRNVFARLELPIDDLVARNVSKDRRSYGEFYTPGLAKSVAEIYRKDIQVFGYRFNEVRSK